MADRIFPSAEQESLGSPKQINTIDWEKFAATLDMRLAEDESKQDDKEEGEEEVKTEAPESKEEEEEEEGTEEPDQEEAGMAAKTAAKKMPKDVLKMFKEKESPSKPKGKVPPQLAPFVKKKTEETKEPKNDGPMKRKGLEKTCEKCGVAYSGSKCSCASTTASRKIIFNSPAEISAEALMKAKNAGDEQLVRAILSAREDRNRIIEARLEKLAQDETEKNQRLAQRRAYRAQIIAETESSAARLASAEASVANDNEEFKRVTSMKNDEKKIVAQRLLDNGFPAEYVEAALGMYSNQAPISEEETQIREIMSSSLNSSTKRTAVAGLVKVAKLSQEQLDRCIRFWVDELGYGDEEWVRDLFSSK